TNGSTDVYTRWAVSATNAAKDKNWSVDASGVVTWDTVNLGSIQTFDGGIIACGALGKKVPTVEQLKSLYDTHGATPPGFNAFYYRSSTEYSLLNTQGHIVYFLNGVVTYNPKTNSDYVRCVQ
ncbi:DUF1566 domain-containing protein, partial [Patescibacteria group bacterium]|nr:DUF1566 domain-containing protein [Patescibacteria group bacterium]